MRDPFTMELPAPHSRGEERDRDLFCSGYQAAEDDCASDLRTVTAALNKAVMALKLTLSELESVRALQGLRALIAELEEV